jgi:FKBP-type peptidyl-prolyl cis-trans isomerase FkpA
MKNNNVHYYLLFVVVVLLTTLVSCNPANKYEEEEKSQIQTYLKSNPNQVFELKPSGLYYLEVLAGTGRAPVIHDTAYIKYTGKFLDGIVFDTNVGKTDTLSFPVNEGWMIEGMDEAITYMKQGGKSTVLIPSSLAYGTTGYYIIPGYTSLLFEIELVRVKPGPGK